MANLNGANPGSTSQQKMTKYADVLTEKNVNYLKRLHSKKLYQIFLYFFY